MRTLGVPTISDRVAQSGGPEAGGEGRTDLSPRNRCCTQLVERQQLASFLAVTLGLFGLCRLGGRRGVGIIGVHWDVHTAPRGCPLGHV
jgi:hypothetical protein